MEPFPLTMVIVLAKIAGGKQRVARSNGSRKEWRLHKRCVVGIIIDFPFEKD
jgi:hypothetical protein